MPKYRKLPLTVIDSLDMADMPDDFTRLTWLMLPLIVCKDGRGFDIPQWLVSKLYPARTDVDASMIAAAMDWYESRNMIRRYEVAGRRYFHLVNFSKHQGDTSREADSPYPAPLPDEQVAPVEVEATDPTPELLTTNSGAGREQVVSNSRSIQYNANTRQGQGNRARAVERPKPPPKRSPSPPPKQELTPEKQAFADMVNALGDVCGMSPAMNYEALSGYAEQLIESGYTADQVLRHFSKPHGWWYTHDWRGRDKGDVPYPKQVIEKIYGAVQSDTPTQQEEGGKLWLEHIKVFN